MWESTWTSKHPPNFRSLSLSFPPSVCLSLFSYLALYRSPSLPVCVSLSPSLPLSRSHSFMSSSGTHVGVKPVPFRREHGPFGPGLLIKDPPWVCIDFTLRLRPIRHRPESGAFNRILLIGLTDGGGRETQLNPPFGHKRNAGKFRQSVEFTKEGNGQVSPLVRVLSFNNR